MMNKSNNNSELFFSLKNIFIKKCKNVRKNVNK